MSTFTTISLPLVLLIHLHILNYPRANEPQYDNNLFDGRSKGLKDRVKMTEAITYFLVGQMETNARNILPTYPCTQPSDSLAFRTSLFKYLETLRHRALFSSSLQKSSGNPGSRPQRGQKDGGISQKKTVTAWWWKDVMVRKSLLEECTGERFESLLVAFSTHVLLEKSKAYTQDQLVCLAATAPSSYDDTLLSYRFSRRQWLQRASLLNQRRQKLEVVKRLVLAKRKMGEQYGLEHVVTLAKVKYADIQSQLWSGEQGSAALTNFFRLVGLAVPGSGAQPFLQESEVKPPEVAKSHSSSRPPLLPLAAAHHPTELRRLRRSVMLPPQNIQPLNDKSGASMQLLLSEKLVSAKTTHTRLSEALLRVQQNRKRPPPRQMPDNGFRVYLKMVPVAKAKDLWGKPTVNQALLARLSLHNPDAEDTFEQRINHIRQRVLPPFPSPPDLWPPRGVLVSQIPRPKPGKKASLRIISQTSDIQTPKTSRVAKKPRKSIRASLVHNMINHAPNERKQMFEDEASRVVNNHFIILATEDDSTEDIGFMTPRSKAPSNRIWTSGQKKTPGSAKGAPRRSITMTFEEPLAELPPVPATSTGSMTLPDDQSDSEEVDPRSDTGAGEDGASEDGEHSQTSMTLRELLLAADSSGFGLIDDEEEVHNEEFPGWE